MCAWAWYGGAVCCGTVWRSGNNFLELVLLPSPRVLEGSTQASQQSLCAKHLCPLRHLASPEHNTSWVKRVMGVIFKSTLKVNFNKSPCHPLIGHKSTATLVFPWQTHTASLPRYTTAPHRLPQSEITRNWIPKEKPPPFTRRKERPAKWIHQ